MNMPSGTIDVALEFLDDAACVRLDTQGGRDFLVRYIQEHGIAAYEKPTLALFARLVAASGGTVLDIGANTGLFALVAATAHHETQVYAFEPLMSVFVMLQRNLALNPVLQSRIVPMRFGFSDVAGEQVFYETVNKAGFVPTSSTLERKLAMREGEFREHHVLLQVLDDWVTTNVQSRIGVLKIDVEGHEHAVLQGAGQMIRDHRPMMIVEMLSDCRFDVIDNIIAESDYVDFAIAPTILRQCTRAEFTDDAPNHLLCPREDVGVVKGICTDLGIIFLMNNITR